MAEYIEREAAINAVYEAFADGESAYDAIEAIPAADVVPVRHGQWIVEDITGIVKCSECKNDAPLDTTGGGQWRPPFCHSCGAKMDGSEEVR